jgi:hypothetical protein
MILAATTSQIIDDLSLVHAPGHTPWWYWLLPLLILALASAVGVWLYRKTHAVRPAVVIPPHEMALEELERLQTLMNHDAREFIIHTSRVIRRYIEARFEISAPKRATAEFLLEAQKNPSLTKNHQTLLSEFLYACDFVKFAGYKPNTQELQHIYSFAVSFVKETIPVTPASSERKQEPQAVLAS